MLFRSLLKQLRQSMKDQVQGKSALTLADQAAIASLIEQRDRLIAQLANELLGSVRPEVARRLRAPGQIVANRGKKSP